MSISFDSVPSLRTPSVLAEFNSSQAQQGPAQLPYRALIVGQMTGDGSAEADSLHRVTNVDQVIALAGQGSMLHRMARAWFSANRFTEAWIGVLEDAGSGTAATKTLTITGTASAQGTLSVYLGGERVRVAVAEDDTADTVGTALAAAINDLLDLPVTAGNATGVVTVTFRHKGEVGQEYDVRVNYQDGEETPEGLTVAIADAVSGAGNPVLDDLIEAMSAGDRQFHVIAHPYTDDTSLEALEAELTDRWGPTRMIDGNAITASSLNHSDVSDLGEARNSKFNSILSTFASPTPPMECAANFAAVVAYYGAIDPARPFQTLALRGMKAPAEADRFTLTERDQLLRSGIATSKVVGGLVQIDRAITTYQKSAGGSPDTAYLDLTTMLTLMYARYSIVNRLQNKFPRHKLASDGTRVAAGQAIVTPKIAKAECILWFRELESLGLLEGFDQFKADLVVERNESDPTRLDILLPPDLINPLIQTAISVQFRL